MNYFCICIFVKAVGTGHNNHNVFAPVEVSQVQYFLHKVLRSFYGMPLCFVRNQMLMFFYYWQNEMRGQVFSMAFLVFHVSVKCSIPPFQVYSVILSVLCTVLLFTFERHGSFLNSFKFPPFFLILDNSIFMLHIIFLCIVVKICYKTSYMAPSVADILYFSASRMCLNYLLLTTVV